MKILLLSANREKNPYPVFPLGLSYLSGPLGRAGHRLRLLDLCFCDDPPAAIEKEFAEFAPEAVVISVRNVDNVTYPGSRSYLSGLREVADRCRGRARVIVGGSGFSLLPLPMLEHLDADYGVVGEGEDVLPELLERIGQGLPTADLPGVIARGESCFLPPAPVRKIHAADRSLFQVERYHIEGGMANVQTKRGCPFSCIYCNYPLLEGKSVRLRPINEVVSEIRSLVQQHGFSYLYFVDDVFNYPSEYAEELCRKLARQRLPVNWCAFVNPGFFGPSLLDAMSAAGCDAIEFGSESGSDLMLRNLRKSFRARQIKSASRLCREAGVSFAHYLLFGGPGESEGTVDETCAVMDEVRGDAVIAMTGIRVFPGTALHGKAIEDGVIAAEDPLLEPAFYIEPEIRDSLCELVAKRALARRNWVLPGMEVNVSDWMLEALRRFPVRGPLWKHLKRLGRSRVRPM